MSASNIQLHTIYILKLKSIIYLFYFLDFRYLGKLATVRSKQTDWFLFEQKTAQLLNLDLRKHITTSE